VRSANNIFVSNSPFWSHGIGYRTRQFRDRFNDVTALHVQRISPYNSKTAGAEWGWGDHFTLAIDAIRCPWFVYLYAQSIIRFHAITEDDRRRSKSPESNYS